MARSGEALSKSKRAIFASHRGDLAGAEHLLSEVQTQLRSMEKSIRSLPELKHEGSYRAALEEYAEASLFVGFLKTGGIEKLNGCLQTPSVYLAGLADATGEMVRYATRQVTLGNPESVKDVRAVVSMVIEFMLDLDLTGYLRTKFDQAKKNLTRLEEMSYDLAIRDRH
jgi:predicted translin family RNA/ssDNA-binding protein